MSRRNAKKLLVLAGAIGSMAASQASAAGVSIRQLGEQQLRLATIGYRIAAANAESCARPEMMSGIIAHDLTQYPLASRPLVTQAFSIHAGFGVLEIVPGSVADRAGLKIDDEILAVGDASVEDQPAVDGSRQSYTREDQFAGILSAALAKGPASLLVRRAGQLLRLTLQGQAGCGGNVVLSTSSNLNAWSDGTRVMVTTAMMEQAANDDELAFVIAHEMAHNILGHAQNDSMGLFGLLGFGSGRIKRMEVDADSYAVPLMNAAGYSPFGGIAFLEAASRRMWWSDLSLDHPSFGRRIKIVTAAIGRLPQTSGLRLAQL